MVQQAVRWLAQGAASLTQAVMQVVQAKIDRDTRGGISAALGVVTAMTGQQMEVWQVVQTHISYV
jgi:hypothetical protein